MRQRYGSMHQYAPARARAIRPIMWAGVNAPLLWHRWLAIDHPALDLDSAAHGIDNAGELCEEAVTGVLHDSAPMLLNLRSDQLAEMGFEPLVGALLIRAHQSGIARDIGGEDSSETADRGHVVPGGKVP